MKNGYSKLEKLRNRFVDACNYHNLNTNKSIEITHQLYYFAIWMLFEDLNTKVFDSSTCLGFNHYWNLYITTHVGIEDITININDFGKISFFILLF